MTTIKGEYDDGNGLKVVTLTKCVGGFEDAAGHFYSNDARGLRVTHYEGHEVIGHVFSAYAHAKNEVQHYLCDSWESNCGYWMTNTIDPKDRRNVSERAIGRTFHRVQQEPDKPFVYSDWVNSGKKSRAPQGWGPNGFSTRLMARFATSKKTRT